ncbi:hypothetical protein DYH09_00570 [bacterium CPR1]|nr:hypothetical protein [bacterium CPR1]
MMLTRPAVAAPPSEAQKLRHKLEFLEMVREQEAAELTKASARLQENLDQIQLTAGRLTTQAEGIHRLSQVRRALPVVGMASGLTMVATAASHPILGLAAGLVCLACIGGIEATDRQLFPQRNQEFWDQKGRHDALMATHHELLGRVQGSAANLQSLQGQLNGTRGELDLALRSTMEAEQAVAEVERLASSFKGGASLVREEKGRILVGGTALKRRLADGPR